MFQIPASAPRSLPRRSVGYPLLALLLGLRGAATENPPASVLPSMTSASSITLPAHTPGFNYYGRWNLGPTAITLNSGAIVEFAYSGDKCVLSFDVAGFDDYPGIFVQVDNGPVVKTTLSAAINTVTVTPRYSDLPKGEPPYAVPASQCHFVRFWTAIHSQYKTPRAGTQWTNLEGACKFQDVSLAAGRALIPLPYDTDQIEFLGDSMIQGQRLLYTGTNDDVGNQLPHANWPQLTADFLGMKPVATGFGGQAMSAPGTCGVPKANDAFPFIYAGAPWTPAVKPKVVVIYQGTNGRATAEEFQSLYVAYLATVRRTYPDALIFAVCPHQRPQYSGAIRAATEAQHDARIRFLDYSVGVILPGDMCDAPQGHLNPGGAVKLAATLARDIATVPDFH